MVCKMAIAYATEHKGCTALGYLKAKGLAVSTPHMTFEQRVKMMSEEEAMSNDSDAIGSMETL